MREDNDFGHYVPILRRIIILVAVITAVPVALWTITAFVRAYVVPAKVPTFHQLASTASINTQANSTSPKSGDQPAVAAEQTKSTDPQLATTGQNTALADAGDSSAAPKGPLLGDHAPQAGVNPAPSGTMKMASVPAAVPPAPQWAEARSTTGALPAPAASETAAPNAAMVLATQRLPAAAAEPAAEALTPAAPLTGLVPLPRQRPRDAYSVRIADMAPSNVPIPRRRPDAAGPGAPAEASGSPIGFIQNLFH
jgi:hypothetical protein